MKQDNNGVKKIIKKQYDKFIRFSINILLKNTKIINNNKK